ncbi:MAG: hypothetical protein HYU66_00145 [Armatimonadetes bacterium]|nr:hypothetical protein [Armatimonadota bacterium]
MLLLPAAAVLGLVWRQQPDRSLLHPLGALQLTAPLIDSGTGQDRCGDHFAVLAGDARLHVFALETGLLRDQALRSPFAPRSLRSLEFAFLDLNQDDRLDLCLNRTRGLGHVQGTGTRRFTAVYEQRGSGFQLTEVGLMPRLGGRSERSRQLVSGGKMYELRALLAAGERGETAVARVPDGKVVRRLPGFACQVFDANLDGDQDVLTYEVPDQRLPDVEYRLFLSHGRKFRQAWQRRIPQHVPDTGELNIADLADLDSDGRQELIFVEPASGRVSVWGSGRAGP